MNTWLKSSIYQTSVSETIRKPPFVKAQTALKNQKNKIWRKMIFNMADRIITPCNVAWSWHWFRQVTAAFNVACGSGIVTVNSPSGSTLQCDMWFWDDMPLNSPKCPPYWNSTSPARFSKNLRKNLGTSEEVLKTYENLRKNLRQCWFSKNLKKNLRKS